MDVYLNLNGHANTASLPLRLGRRISLRHQQFVVLDPATHDDAGTRGQRQDEIERGCRHYLGVLHIPHEDPSSSDPYLVECRVVLGAPSSAEQRPPVVTILRADNNKGDLTVTRHLEGMLKKGKINVEDLIGIFHPAYLRGELLTSNQCEEIYDAHIRGRAPVQYVDEPTARALSQEPTMVAEAMEVLDVGELGVKAPLTFKALRIPKVKYAYVMADAYIWNVRLDDEMIKFSCINSSGLEQEMRSFKARPHLVSLHQYAYRYLKDREEQRALFAICNSEPCRGVIAESVTAIALQMMRAGIASAPANLKPFAGFNVPDIKPTHDHFWRVRERRRGEAEMLARREAAYQLRLEEMKKKDAEE